MKPCLVACGLLLVACGRDEELCGGQAVCLVDAGPVGTDTGGGCNPVAQTSCVMGQKCTWIRLDSDPGEGTLGCVADGTIPLGGECTYGPDGLTGYDDCAAGRLCVGGVCEEICTHAPDSCQSTTTTCDTYEGLLPETSGFGVCDFHCNPIVGCTGDRGCYGYPGHPFACAPVPDAAVALTHGTTAYGPDDDHTFVNGCAAGYLPLLWDPLDAASPIVCVATCQPGEVHAGALADLDGLSGSGNTCTDRGATAPGTECHFIWSFEQFPTFEDNTIGFCWDPSQYIGDWDRDSNTADAPWPSCAALTTTLIDSDGDGTPDVAEHRYYGCAPLREGEAPEVRYARPLPTGFSGDGPWSL